MSRQTISRQSPLTEELTTETVDAQPDRRDVAGHDDSRSQSTVLSRPTSFPAPQPAPRPGQPRGHVIGHAIGEPAAPSFAERPRGHVVGHAIGEPAAPSLAERAHVVGHGVGKALPLPSRATSRKAA